MTAIMSHISALLESRPFHGLALRFRLLAAVTVLTSSQIQDIKALLGEKTEEEKKEVPQSCLIDLLSLGRAGSGFNLENLLPTTQEHRDFLLEVYFANVDPMVRVTHTPTVNRKIYSYNLEAHPMAYAIYFAAVNSLSPKAIVDKFGENKKDLLNRFQLGIEISLARENYLTTSDLEVFQGFVLWLSCITREEDMGKPTVTHFVSKANQYDRQSVGIGRHSYTHCAKPRAASRSISISCRINGRHHYRNTSPLMAPTRSAGIQGCRVQRSRAEHNGGFLHDVTPT